MAPFLVRSCSAVYRVLSCHGTHFAECWYSRLALEDRTAHFEDQGAVAMELVAAIAMFGVVLVIVGVAFDAARRAK